MANDRYRYDQDRDDDDGYIARRGFGNQRSGYGGDRDRTRERDFGDSAGYGTGGSARDWREVVGDDPRPEGPLFNFDRRDRGPQSQGRDRHEQASFGRGSRDYNEDRGFFERVGDEVGSWFGGDDDRSGGGQHRGRGPKGYQRSDTRILEDVNDRLTDDPHVDASGIDVSVTNREVTLNGTVNSRFEKRHAEDIAESVSGVAHVQNNLRIQQYMDAGMGGSMLSGAGAAGAGPAEMPEPGAAGAGAIPSGGAKPRRTDEPSGT